MRAPRIALASALLLSASLLAACGDDAAQPPTPGGGDAAADVTTPPLADAEATPDGGGDAADAGPKKFSDYVKELVTTQTDDTRAPDPRVLDPWVDDEDPAAYPASFFP